MHLSSYLVIAGLSTSVHAFYPWELKVATGATISSRQNGFRRFMPWILVPDSSDSDSDNQGITLDITKARRADTYQIVESETPTLQNSAAVNQDGVDFSYFVTVKVGSQQEEMWLALDTGSPSSWVFSSKCTTETCTNHHTFDISESSSFSSNDSTYSLGYGSGEVKGDLGQDTMSIAGMDITFTFGFAKSATDPFDNYPIDGILGLGRSYTGGWKIPSFMDVVAEKAGLSSNIVGLSLSRASDNKKDGEVNFGTVDTTKFDGEISYTNTTAETWTIPLDDVYVNGKAGNFTGKSATIDSGSTYVFVPPADAATLFGLIPNSKQSGENYIIPCDSTATIEFEFSGVKYTVQPDDYIGTKSKDDSKPGCISTIVGHQSSASNTWLLGDVFLKNVYSVFDFDSGQIGFGTKVSNSSSGNGTFVAPSATATGPSAAVTDGSTEVSSAAISTTTADPSSDSATETDSPTINSASRMSGGLALSLVMTFAAALIL
ncbi:Aspartic-type endopeptidase ctsD [Penicillium cosmopolitanum]|uniref:Aspartic-type endopeptidase ctsD n=1 Tax=Penicillium cosmopolitanum TaxID=1131564 RepID=A0A9W9W4G2_9EURO|nr:Aspartic-type endopeptidase ctsD [Penicillium cosmopolitanum]KAJ5403309.1 Aspartic-type endopeptidase ctsD [Penicillium cosmopolitanum]